MCVHILCIRNRCRHHVTVCQIRVARHWNVFDSYMTLNLVTNNAPGLNIKPEMCWIWSCLSESSNCPRDGGGTGPLSSHRWDSTSYIRTSCEGDAHGALAVPARKVVNEGISRPRSSKSSDSVGLCKDLSDCTNIIN